MIRHTAVRETAVSWQNGGSIKVPIVNTQTSPHYGIKGHKGDPQLGPHYDERQEPIGI